MPRKVSGEKVRKCKEWPTKFLEYRIFFSPGVKKKMRKVAENLVEP